MNKKEFDKLDEKEKRHSATKALAWFCVTTEFNPFFQLLQTDPETAENIECLKIIVGKYMNAELKEVK